MYCLRYGTTQMEELYEQVITDIVGDEHVAALIGKPYAELYENITMWVNETVLASKCLMWLSIDNRD